MRTARLKAGDFDWDTIFSGGVRWFHSGGIFAALSETTSDLIVEAMRAARRAGAVVSFDLNFRDKLWKGSGNPERSRSAIRKIVDEVDVLIGGPRDFHQTLGIGEASDAWRTKPDPNASLAAIEQVVNKYARIKIVATTLREVHSASRHSWGAMAWINGQAYASPTCELDVYDRVGSGDGFAAGFFYGLLTGAPPATNTLHWGWAHGALLAAYPGGTTMATLDQVRALAEGSSPRIQR